jgi:RimJ/RimL family protein N-acetyltransferase
MGHRTRCPFVREEAGRRSARALDRLPDREDIEVLYALERAAWGRGFAREAAAAAVRYGFHVVGLDRIVAVIRHANTGSRRVLEKLGLRYEGDVEVYGVVAACDAMTVEEFGVGADTAAGAS